MSDIAPYFYAYSNNFKGSPDGWHKLKKVNFLVGENSTGKSSFQQLFKIVSSQQFVFAFDALGIIPTISTPNDIIGRLSGSPHVTIGFAALHKSETEGEQQRFYGRIVTYLELEGVLTIGAITFATKDYVFTLVRDAESGIKLHHSAEVSSQTLFLQPEILEEIHDRVFEDEIGEFLDFEDFDFSEDSWRSAALAASKKIGESKLYNPIMMPQSFHPLSYGPSRRAPQRLLHGGNTSFSSSGAHAPFVFKDVVQYIPEIEEKLTSYGLSSGLFDFISIDEVETKAGDRPFIVTVGKSGKHFYIDELGYGVSQILPVVIDILVADTHRTLFIQQPELHLHPRAQAEFGSFIHENAKESPSLVVETHSDFIIDRFRVVQAKSNLEEKVSSQVLFFLSDSETGFNYVHAMEIDNDGQFDRVPEEYRTFFVDENMKMLEAL